MNLRKFTIENFERILDSLKQNDKISDCNFIIITNFAYIVCGIFQGENLSSDDEEIARKVLDAVNNILPKSANNDSTTILLKNVVIRPFINPAVQLYHKTLVLFVDQIVGITFGNLRQECV